MRLPRPYIPLAVRVAVAERQFDEKFGYVPRNTVPPRSKADWLNTILLMLFGDQPVELHHDPALCNRFYGQCPPNGDLGYEPDANDPNYLVYLPKDLHDVRTRVRGERGQHSDLALARKRKRIECKKHTRKFKWPKRKLQSRGFR